MVMLLGCSATAQQTVFNVPSGDVLDKRKAYGELDTTYKKSERYAGFTPRIVFGVGGRVEVGVNINGLGTQGELQTTLTPALKWKAYDGGGNGWAFLVGDDGFIPVQNGTYRVGNYLYAEIAKTWRTKTRLTAGAYHFTRNVVASAQRAGGQFALEEPIGSRITVAADWYTGDQSLGYFTPGIVIKLTPKLTWYGTYQIGNSQVSEGNQVLMEFGWNLN
jgi:hypothetical protein